MVLKEFQLSWMHFMYIKFVFYFSSSEIFQHIKLLTVIGNVLHLEHWATYQQIYQHNFFGSVMLWFLVHRCKHVSRMNDSEKWITNRHTHFHEVMHFYVNILLFAIFIPKTWNANRRLAAVKSLSFDFIGSNRFCASNKSHFICSKNG